MVIDMSHIHLSAFTVPCIGHFITQQQKSSIKVMYCHPPGLLITCCVVVLYASLVTQNKPGDTCQHYCACWKCCLADVCLKTQCVLCVMEQGNLTCHICSQQAITCRLHPAGCTVTNNVCFGPKLAKEGKESIGITGIRWCLCVACLRYCCWCCCLLSWRRRCGWWLCLSSRLSSSCQGSRLRSSCWGSRLATWPNGWF